MACNCKNKVNPKYTSETSNTMINERYSSKFFTRLLQYLFQFLVGIFCTAVLIVGIVPFMVYVGFCLMTGKEAKFRIINPNRKKK